MTVHSPVGDFIARQVRVRRVDLALAALAGMVTTASATWLLGLSGWFLAGAALAGAAGPTAVQAFNYLLPSAGFRGLAIARTAGRYGERLFSHRAAFHALADLRPALFAGLAAAPPRWWLALSSGEAAARLVQDVNAIETEFVRRSAPWAAATAAGAAGGVIAIASPVAALAFIGLLGVQILAGRRLGDRLTRIAGRDQLRVIGRFKDGLGAYLQAAPELACFDLTERAVEALMVHDAELSRAGLSRNDAEALLTLIQSGLVALTVLAVAVLASGASLPMMALAVLAALAGMEGVGGLLRAAQQQGAFREAVDRLDAVLAAPAPAARPRPVGAHLEIDGLFIPPGGRLGIAGPSGCGKSMLLESLIGLRSPPPGRIRIDGRPLEADPPGAARSLFAYAPQDARLLTGTIAENLRLAAPTADDAELWGALADARLDARVRRLAEGLHTWIGDGGEVLSGGERRRLALARCYLRPAAWLVLDEPTEGLDRQTEVALVAALERRLSRTGQGLIVVSHRPEPLRLCAARLDLGVGSAALSAPGDTVGDEARETGEQPACHEYVAGK